MRRLLLMGPPGSGKGTQAAICAARLGASAISTGDIFRANVAGKTPLGIEAKKYIAQGEYVPDSVTNAMVRSRLSRPDAATGFILDGYPRTVSQVEFLDDVLAEQGKSSTPSSRWSSTSRRSSDDCSGEPTPRAAVTTPKT